MHGYRKQATTSICYCYTFGHNYTLIQDDVCGTQDLVSSTLAVGFTLFFLPFRSLSTSCSVGFDCVVSKVFVSMWIDCDIKSDLFDLNFDYFYVCFSCFLRRSDISMILRVKRQTQHHWMIPRMQISLWVHFSLGSSAMVENRMLYFLIRAIHMVVAWI